MGCIYGLLQGVSFLFFSIFYWCMLTMSNGHMWTAIHTGPGHQTVGQSDESSLSFNTLNKFRPIKRSCQDTLPSFLELSWLTEEERDEVNRFYFWRTLAFFFGSIELIGLSFYCRQWICHRSEKKLSSLDQIIPVVWTCSHYCDNLSLVSGWVSKSSLFVLCTSLTMSTL